MSTGWSNPDVTPVGGEPGSRADADRPLSRPPGEDPFGSRPSRVRRGWVRVVLGALLAVGGVLALGYGIVEAVRAGNAITDDAVARGTVREGGGQEATFVVPDREDREYTVYLQFSGVFSNDEDEDLTVRDTRCVATTSTGERVAFGGNRQDVAATIGGSASVNHFAAPAGPTVVRCGYGDGTRSSRVRRPDSIGFVVTPGTPSLAGDGVLYIFGGVGANLLGGFLFWSGWRRRRPV